ncbi:MAG TPA: aminotransferase class V-fold PLP-dependent enzyme [Terriglobales bacterium]|nr:aminotransferase class V-fold PLP-dependent enzyme [Terriglobales bacterium]
MNLDQARTCFPIVQQRIYCNNAAIAPLALPTRQAMEQVLAQLCDFGPPTQWQQWVAALGRVRATLARLVNAAPAEIAFTKNTSEGLATIAQGLDWRPGDRIVAFDCEFPANLYPWLALRSRGVVVELLPAAALTDLDRLRRACRGARLLSLSLVQFVSGFRADLEAVGAICRETGTWFLVDAIQGLGAFPVDVKRAGVHALAADGHKWLTAPEGAAFLFVDEAFLPHLVPPEVGWLSVAAWDDISASQRAAAAAAPILWRPGAARFECGTLNYVGLIGLGAAVELLLAVGIETIAAHLLALGDRLAAGLRQQGCELLQLSAAPQHRSGITSFRHPSQSADHLVARLEAAHIVCSNRDGWVRCSPHLYNSHEEIDTLLARLF